VVLIAGFVLSLHRPPTALPTAPC